jgi:hypothetical protein
MKKRAIFFSFITIMIWLIALILSIIPEIAQDWQNEIGTDFLGFFIIIIIIQGGIIIACYKSTEKNEERAGLTADIYITAQIFNIINGVMQGIVFIEDYNFVHNLSKVAYVLFMATGFWILPFFSWTLYTNYLPLIVSSIAVFIYFQLKTYIIRQKKNLSSWGKIQKEYERIKSLMQSELWGIASTNFDDLINQVENYISAFPRKKKKYNFMLGEREMVHSKSKKQIMTYEMEISALKELIKKQNYAKFKQAIQKLQINVKRAGHASLSDKISELIEDPNQIRKFYKYFEQRNVSEVNITQICEYLILSQKELLGLFDRWSNVLSNYKIYGNNIVLTRDVDFKSTLAELDALFEDWGARENTKEGKI